MAVRQQNYTGPLPRQLRRQAKWSGLHLASYLIELHLRLSDKDYTGITVGRSSIRATLYMPAVVAKRANPRLAAFADQLAARVLCRMEIIVAVMRKLLHFAFGVLKSGQPFDPGFDPVAVS